MAPNNQTAAALARSHPKTSVPTQTVVNIADVEREALSLIPKHALDYYRSGAGDELTLAENCSAFNQLRIRPRFLRDMSKRNTQTTILGIPVSFPVCVAPTAMQRMATPMGEVANALGKFPFVPEPWRI